MKWNKSPLTIVSILSGGGGDHRRGRWRKKALVSLLYPNYLSENMIGGSSFSGGSLVEVIKNYDSGFDTTFGEAFFSGGLLESVVKQYAFTELLTGGAVFSGGTLQSNVYFNPPENIIGSAVFSGVFTQSLPYQNWIPEQINGAATFAGGTMG